MSAFIQEAYECNINKSVIEERVQYKNVCYTSNLVGPKAHNTIHVNTVYNNNKVIAQIFRVARNSQQTN